MDGWMDNLTLFSRRPAAASVGCLLARACVRACVRDLYCSGGAQLYVHLLPLTA
jgi:hypothetical protein